MKKNPLHQKIKQSKSKEKRFLIYPDLGYNCELRKIRAKNVSLTVYPNNRIVIRSPKFVSQSFIIDFLKERKDWVQTQYDKNLQQNPPKTSFLEGEVLPLFGTKKKIVLTKDQPSHFTLHEMVLNVSSIRSENGRLKLAKKMIGDELEKRALPLIMQSTSKLGTYKYSTNIKSMRSLWGSCSYKNKITLNLALAFCPEFVLRYVIYHEVAHTVERNHSKKFWVLVEKLDPNYSEAEKWIKTNGKKILCYLY